MAVGKQPRPATRPAFVPHNLEDPSQSRIVDGVSSDLDATRSRVAALEAVAIMSGTALPNLNVAATQGTLYVRIAGDSSSLWFKKTTTGKSGWVQVI